MKDGKTFLMAPADYRALFEKDKEPKEAKESTAKEDKELRELKEDKEQKEQKEPKESKDDSKASKEPPNSGGGSSQYGKAIVPEADDGAISKRQSSKLKRSDSKNSLKKVKRSTPAFADKDHPPAKKSQERLRSQSHGRHGNRSHSSHSHGHTHSHKSSADNKKSHSKKSIHSQKCSKNKGCSGVSATGSSTGGTHSHHGNCKSKDQPVTMTIGTMTVINYGSSDGPLPKGIPGVSGQKANEQATPPAGRGEKNDNSKA